MIKEKLLLRKANNESQSAKKSFIDVNSSRNKPPLLSARANTTEDHHLTFKAADNSEALTPTSIFGKMKTN